MLIIILKFLHQSKYVKNLNLISQVKNLVLHQVNLGNDEAPMSPIWTKLVGGSIFQRHETLCNQTN